MRIKSNQRSQLSQSFAFLFLIYLVNSSVANVAIDDFFPFGTSNGDTIAPAGDDGFVQTNLYNPFIFFNQTYDRIFVNNNGGLSFREGVSQFTPTCGPLQQPMIVAFWADINTALGGNIFYRESTDKKLLTKAEIELQKAFPNFWKITKSLGWLFIATWDNVPFYGASSNCNGLSKRNTFQLIVASDGIHSFAMFYYHKIDWTTGTASGGDCGGLNGTPAKAGFDYGDNKTFHEIGSSCTPNIIDIESSTNINDPGKWVFRIDNSVESAQCENKDNFDTSKRLTIKPAFVRLFGHIPITLSGPCLTNVTQVSCRFNDPVEKTSTVVNGTFDEDTSSTICNVPILYGYGRIKVELTVKHGEELEEIFYGYLFCMDLEDDTSVKISSVPDNDEEVEIDIQWNPEYFIENSVKGDRRRRSLASDGQEMQTDLQLSMLEYDVGPGTKGAGKWKVDGIVLKDIPNTGRTKKRMKRKKVIGSDGNPGKVISYSVGVGGLQPVFYVHEEIPNVPSKTLKETFTPLLCTNTILPFQNNIKACDEWYQEDTGVPNDILRCPPLQRQVQEDDRFELDEATGETLQFFHQGADISYRQKIPSPKGGGQQCTYKNGKLLVGPPGGGTADRVSPKTNKFKHWWFDVLPWCRCCAHSNDTASCRKYYERRPSDPGNDYAPPRPTRAVGDPHISTFDSTTYTFNGVGEFWMVKTEDDSFSMQARMEQFTTENGALTNASMFTAFVMEEVDKNNGNESTIVQILIKSSGIVLIIDGEVVDFSEFDDEEMKAFFKTNAKTIMVNGVTVTEDNGEFIVSFSSGFSFVFSSSDNKSLNIVGSADESLVGKVKGLLGDFDKNPENDLTTPDGTIVPSSSSIEHIHYNFGLKWMITEDDSLFIYSAGDSYSTYKKHDFQPNFNFPNISEVSSEIRDTCGESIECLFDFATTGSLTFANNTKQVVEYYEEVVEVSEIIVSMCEPIENFENGYYETENYFVDSQVKFYCNEGYELVGQAFLKCESLGWNGKEVGWNYELPYCRGNSSILVGIILISVGIIVSISILLICFLFAKRQKSSKKIYIAVPR